jgi:hypothetical protein
MSSVIKCITSFFGALTNNNDEEIYQAKEQVDKLTNELTFMYSTKKFNKKNSNYVYYNKHKRDYSRTYLNKEIMSMECNDGRTLSFHKPGTFDIRPFWNTLKFTDYNYYKDLNYYYLLTTERFAKKYDGIYVVEWQDIKNNIVLTDIVDAYSDICIYDATYAKLVIENGEEIDLDYDKANKCFTFIDITQQNPLFAAYNDGYWGKNYKLKIVTDGSCYSIKKYYINSVKFRCFLILTNGYSMTWFPSKEIVLFSGHLNRPSFISRQDQIITLDFNEDNEVYKSKFNNIIE